MSAVEIGIWALYILGAAFAVAVFFVIRDRFGKLDEWFDDDAAWEEWDQ